MFLHENIWRNHQQRIRKSIMDNQISNSLGKPPKLNKCNRKRDLDKHVQLVDKHLNYFHIDESSKCKLFALTLKEFSRLWLEALQDGNIELWTGLCESFTTHFTPQKIDRV